jgi:hypothetical protein
LGLNVDDLETHHLPNPSCGSKVTLDDDSPWAAVRRECGPVLAIDEECASTGDAGVQVGEGHRGRVTVGAHDEQHASQLCSPERVDWSAGCEQHLSQVDPFV